MLKSQNILKQEEEFVKLNEEIEMKTKSLINQVNHLKEMHSNFDKVYSDWKESDMTSRIQDKDDDGEDEQNELGTSKLSSEDDYGLAADSNGGEFDKETAVTTETEVTATKTDTLRRNAKASRSAKTSPLLMSTTNVGQEPAGFFLGITRHKSDVKGSIENDVLPETLKGVGQEGVVRFLTAKVKLLTEQIEIMRKDRREHLEKIKELQAHKEKSLEEREKLIQQTNLAKNVLVKYEQHTNQVVSQLQTVQAENGHLKKELENLKKELRQSNQSNSANEVRLNRTLGEVDKLKATLQQAKQDEKEFREIHRKKMEDLSTTVKKLDKQRTELLNGFKKQLLIIDNLKRQKGLMEAGKLLKNTEEDFMNFLDCNPQNSVRHVNVKSVRS